MHITDKPRYINTRDMSIVSLYIICQYIETEFHSINGGGAKNDHFLFFE